jgi:hypothetical protein
MCVAVDCTGYLDTVLPARNVVRSGEKIGSRLSEFSLFSVCVCVCVCVCLVFFETESCCVAHAGLSSDPLP